MTDTHPYAERIQNVSAVVQVLGAAGHRRSARVSTRIKSLFRNTEGYTAIGQDSGAVHVTHTVGLGVPREEQQQALQAALGVYATDLTQAGLTVQEIAVERPGLPPRRYLSVTRQEA